MTRNSGRSRGCLEGGGAHSSPALRPPSLAPTPQEGSLRDALSHTPFRYRSPPGQALETGSAGLGDGAAPHGRGLPDSHRARRAFGAPPAPRIPLSVAGRKMQGERQKTQTSPGQRKSSTVYFWLQRREQFPRGDSQGQHVEEEHGMHIRGRSCWTHRGCVRGGLRCTQNTDLASQTMQPTAHPPPARSPARAVGAQRRPSPAASHSSLGRGHVCDSDIPCMGPRVPAPARAPASTPHPGGCMRNGPGGLTRWPARPPHSPEQPLCSPAGLRNALLHVDAASTQTGPR